MSGNEILFAAKKNKGLSFEDIGVALGRGEVWVAALFHGQASASSEEAGGLARVLGLKAKDVEALTACPVKVVPADPLIYPLYEIMQVYGMPLKSVIREKFGDGIMSAIDFSLHVDREEDPEGDRVRLTMSGRFLPYKKW